MTRRIEEIAAFIEYGDAAGYRDRLDRARQALRDVPVPATAAAGVDG